VFRTSMIMLSAASPGALDDYAEGIRHLTTFHPNAWSDIATADEKMRWELWDRMHEELVQLLVLGHPPVGYNPKMSWGYIIGASTYGPPTNPTAYWWTVQLVGGLSSSSSTQSVVAALEGRAAGRQQQGRPDRPVKAPPAKGVCREFNKGNCTLPCPGNWAHICSHCKKPNHGADKCFTKPGNAGPKAAGVPLLRPKNKKAGKQHRK
jgi:hypothetical protein